MTSQIITRPLTVKWVIHGELELGRNPWLFGSYVSGYLAYQEGTTYAKKSVQDPNDICITTFDWVGETPDTDKDCDRLSLYYYTRYGANFSSNCMAQAGSEPKLVPNGLMLAYSSGGIRLTYRSDTYTAAYGLSVGYYNGIPRKIKPRWYFGGWYNSAGRGEPDTTYIFAHRNGVDADMWLFPVKGDPVENNVFHLYPPIRPFTSNMKK